MKLIFVGKQGSGKGTQAKKVSKEFTTPHISTGDMLRNAEGDLKSKVESYMEKGELVPDKIIVGVLSERIKKEDCNNGFILDGFPRTELQAKELSEVTDIDKVVRIYISNEESIKRLSGRVHCNKCGANYNLNTQPKPKNESTCDKCGGELIRRKDDNPEAIKERLENYQEKIKQVFEYYNELNVEIIEIDGEQDINKVTEEILKKLDKEIK